MKLNPNSEEGRSLLQYVTVVLFFFISLAAVSVYSLNSFLSLTKEEARISGENLVKGDADILNRLIDDGKSRLQVVRRVSEYIIDENMPIAEMESLFVAETKRYKQDRDSNFSGVYGYVKGTYLDGSGWVPGQYYDALERPWYKVAMADSGFQISSHIDLSKRQRVISISRRLADGRSVVALNMSLQNLKKSFAGMNRSEDQWLILDTNGVVVDHHDYFKIGLNFLLAQFTDSDEKALAEAVLAAKGNSFELVMGGKVRLVYVATVQNAWSMVRIVDESSVTEKVRWAAVRNVMIATFLFILLTVVTTYGFVKYQKKSRISRIKSLIQLKMHHEINASVNGILGLNAVVVKGVRNQEIKHYAEKVQSAMQGLVALFNDMNDVTRMQSRNDERHASEYDLFTLLSECYRVSGQKAAQKNLQFTMECDPDIPKGLWGDVNQIRQIINNLLADSINRTESGSVSFSVTYSREQKMGSSATESSVLLKVVIRDTGSGVQDENIDFSESSFEKTSAELCLAKLLVDMCGGELVVKSRYGEGTTFMLSISQVVLNVEPVGDFQEKYKSVSNFESAPMDTLFAPMARMLVVDDVDTNLQVVKGLLKDTRIQIDTAVSGAQCLEMIASRRYDLILLDYSLPMMDGVETFERMKTVEHNLNKNTPVIMVTAKSVDYKESYLKLGLADYILKPYQEMDLLRMLAWYLPKNLVLTKDDLPEQMPQPPKPPKEEVVAPVEIELHSVVPLKEKMNVFNDILNVKAGLEYFSNDARCYGEMLYELVLDRKQEMLENAFVAEDWESYKILIYSLVDSMQAIGAEDLVGKVQMVESACRENRYEDIRETHGKLMVAYVQLIEQIKKRLADYEV